MRVYSHQRESFLKWQIILFPVLRNASTVCSVSSEHLHLGSPASLLPWLWGSCWCLPVSRLRDWEGDRWRNLGPITLSCFSFHPSGELQSLSTQRCFQIKYRLMNWKTCPHQACLCVCIYGKHLVEVESMRRKWKKNCERLKARYLLCSLVIVRPACGVMKRVFVNCTSLLL